MTPKRLLVNAIAHHREFGAVATGRLILENLLRPMSPRLARRVRRWYLHRRNVVFDRRHGVGTAGHVDPALPDGGLRYEPTDAESFRWLIRKLDLDWPQFTFVDLGSGKGKVVLLASTLPFRRVIGVEYDRELHETAEANLEAFARGRRGRAPTELVHADALAWEPPPGDLFLYLFNPLTPDLTGNVLETARRSFGEPSRRVVVAYYNLIDPTPFEKDWLEPLIPARELLIGPMQAWLVRTDSRGTQSPPSTE